MEGRKYYLGITGCSTRREVSFCRIAFNKYGLSQSQTHIGSLNFLINNTLKSTKKRYCSIKTLFDLLDNVRFEKIFKMIHYNTSSKNFGVEVINLLNTIGENAYGEDKLYELIDGIQLNLDNPNASEIEKLKTTFPTLKIVFQFNNSFNNQVFEIREKYKAHIDYILIDPSRGKGKSIDLYSKYLVNIYNLINREFNKIIGFAGGFKGDNIYTRCKRIEEIIGNKLFCVDAEENLRRNDSVSSEKVNNYVRNFMKFLRE